MQEQETRRCSLQALAALLAEGAADVTVLDLLPDAAAVRLLPPVLLTTALAPIYGRGPDATPMKARIPA